MRRSITAVTAAMAALAFTGVHALACGGLVAPDGDVRLDKATTFVAWHDGVEHYVTSFAYTGSAADVGWIVPLPAVPSRIEAAGRWTLQRLEREFNPPELAPLAAGAQAASSARSIVVEQVQVEALDVTVLRGSGRQVIDWCRHNGFLLPTDTADHLLRYARGTPVFMAAKYNTSVAQRRGLQTGDGVPLLITMRTPHIWVPLEVLANDNAEVSADLFLLTDAQLRTEDQSVPLLGLFGPTDVDGVPGFVVAGQEPMNPLLHSDLARDRNMAWLPANGWLTYLRLDAPAIDVTYDLGVGRDSVIRLASFGTTPSSTGSAAPSPGRPLPLAASLLGAIVLAGAVYAVRMGSRFATSTGSTASGVSNPSTLLRK